MVMTFTNKHLEELIEIAKQLSVDKIEEMADLLLSTKKNNGRVFTLTHETAMS